MSQFPQKFVTNQLQVVIIMQFRKTTLTYK